MSLRLIRLAALVSSMMAPWACVPDCPAMYEDLIFLVRDPDPETRLLIDQCRDPPHSCMPLCQKVSATPAGRIVHCEIHPQTDPAFTQVHVGVVPGFCE
jgi:hypothetical protein